MTNWKFSNIWVFNCKILVFPNLLSKKKYSKLLKSHKNLQSLIDKTAFSPSGVGWKTYRCYLPSLRGGGESGEQEPFSRVDMHWLRAETAAHDSLSKGKVQTIQQLWGMSFFCASPEKVSAFGIYHFLISLGRDEKELPPVPMTRLPKEAGARESDIISEHTESTAAARFLFSSIFCC